LDFIKLEEMISKSKGYAFAFLDARSFLYEWDKQYAKHRFDSKKLESKMLKKTNPRKLSIQNE